MKLCIDCGAAKGADEFYDGRNQCMECVRATERARYWRNRATRLAVAIAYWKSKQAEHTR